METITKKTSGQQNNSGMGECYAHCGYTGNFWINQFGQETCPNCGYEQKTLNLKPVTILNTSILTDFGDYSYSPISVNEVKTWVNRNGFQSAIGHESTARIISNLLEIDCPVNRILYKQKNDEIALIFKLNGRPEEGKILTIPEIEKIGYSWGLLKKNPIQ